MKFLRRSQFGNERRSQDNGAVVETDSRIDPFMRSPTKPSFAYRTPVSWSATGYGFVRVDHSGVHDDDRIGGQCVHGGDCVEVIEFDVEAGAMKPQPIHLAWPQIKRIETDRVSDSIDLRAPVVHLDSFRTEKVWGEMKKALTPQPKSEG